MQLTWQNLRPWKNSQNLAFEELCCQLAEYESCPPGSRFIRKGTPDGGIECFWTLPSGDEWGWQAKFLFLPFSSGMWGQLDDSVTTALEKHPELSKYTICLPFDRPDSRTEGETSFLEHWNNRVEKWEREAQKLGMSVQFVYWGDHEIGTRLAKEEHAGRFKFWFDQELFSYQWFGKHIKEVVENAGDRYTPVVNVSLPISQVFDGLGRTPSFFSTLDSHCTEIRKAYRRVNVKKLTEIGVTEVQNLEEPISTLLSLLRSLRSHNWSPLPIEGIGRAPLDMVKQCMNLLWAEKDKPTASNASEDSPFRELYYQLNQLNSAIYSLMQFCEGPSGLSANTSALLIVGDAGSGKTHLLCDVASRRTGDHSPTVMLLGQHFNSSEPWSQVLALLHLDCSLEEFLGALDAAAQANGSRGLIFIDALNEGEGEKIWPAHLAGILSRLAGYPRLGIALSVRSSYEKILIPLRLVDEKRLVREQHFGFEEHEYEAAIRFFAHFGIEPSAPILYPEFKNPQFLLLFCKGIQNKGLTRVPTGLHGITSIFEFYLDSINAKLAFPRHLDFDPYERLVQRATERIAELMAQERVRWLPRDKAIAAVNAFLPGSSHEKSLFRHLVSEGVLAEDFFWEGKPALPTKGVRFSYERFADHRIAKYLLEKFFDKNHPSRMFGQKEEGGQFFTDEFHCSQNQGLLEALCIQIPEFFQMELPDLAPHAADFRAMRLAFVNSLMWRHPGAIDKKTYSYINGSLLTYKETFELFFDTVLVLSPVPGHPLNGSFLHSHLMKFSLAERDAWWSVYLHGRFGHRGSVDRLLDWVWSPLQKNDLDHDAAILVATTLTWFCSSSNRFLRDKTTKSLAKMIGSRGRLVLDLLRLFRDVNDPYVLERLLAVAYGCSTKISNKEELAEIGNFVFAWFFANGRPNSHILIRDYARGVIEAALHAGAPLVIDKNKIVPPYKSTWPKSISTEKSLKTKYGEWKEKMPDVEWSRVAIFDSVMGFGDFARYVIGTNSNSFDWSGTRLGKRPVRSPKQKYESFISSLNSTKKRLWDRLEAARFQVIRTQLTALLRGNKSLTKDRLKELTDDLEKSETTFEQELTPKEVRTYRTDVLRYLNNRVSSTGTKPFDLKVAQRWILQRVFDLGWTVELLGAFDRRVTNQSWSRDARKAERIGKKYQWIAYHEFLGMVSDHFQFTGYFQESTEYHGPWQMYLRDIDPTCALLGIPGGSDRHNNTGSCWWSPVNYEWAPETPNEDWIASERDLPKIPPLLEVINPNDGSVWLTLECNQRWEEPTAPGDERFERPARHLWYQIRSFLVARKNFNKVFSWLSKQHYWGRWLPETPDFHGTFLGEFYWAPALRDHSSVFDPSKESASQHAKLVPSSMISTTSVCRAEQNSFDCSVEDNFTLNVPSKWLVEEMRLRWNGREGHYYDQNGVLTAFDPATSSLGPNSLLVRKDSFLRFLRESNYGLLWTLLGGKQIIHANSKRWSGELQISGTFRVRKDEVEGILRPIFRKPK